MWHFWFLITFLHNETANVHILDVDSKWVYNFIGINFIHHLLITSSYDQFFSKEDYQEGKKFDLLKWSDLQ